MLFLIVALATCCQSALGGVQCFAFCNNHNRLVIGVKSFIESYPYIGCYIFKCDHQCSPPPASENCIPPPATTCKLWNSQQEDPLNSCNSRSLPIDYTCSIIRDHSVVWPSQITPFPQCHTQNLPISQYKVPLHPFSEQLLLD